MQECRNAHERWCVSAFLRFCIPAFLRLLCAFLPSCLLAFLPSCLTSLSQTPAIVAARMASSTPSTATVIGPPSGVAA
jgi:hypothetical protein